MDQQTLGRYLKFIIIGMAVCGLAVYGFVLPAFGTEAVRIYPELSHWYEPWLIFLRITVIPCYGVLLFAWKIAGNIGRGRAFCRENGTAFRGIFWMTAVDTMFFMGGNVSLLLSNRNHPGILMLSLVLVFFGLAIAICAKALAQLVDNAAELQEQSDLTI